MMQTVVFSVVCQSTVWCQLLSVWCEKQCVCNLLSLLMIQVWLLTPSASPGQPRMSWSTSPQTPTRSTPSSWMSLTTSTNLYPRSSTTSARSSTLSPETEDVRAERPIRIRGFSNRALLVNLLTLSPRWQCWIGCSAPYLKREGFECRWGQK